MRSTLLAAAVSIHSSAAAPDHSAKAFYIRGVDPRFCTEKGADLLSDANDRRGLSPSKESMSAESDMRWIR